MTLGKRELKYWQDELETAWKKARAADTLGRYQEAAWWENRVAAIAEEIKRIKGDSE